MAPGGTVLRVAMTFMRHLEVQGVRPDGHSVYQAKLQIRKLFFQFCYYLLLLICYRVSIILIELFHIEHRKHISAK